MTIESIKGVEKGKSGMNPDKMKWDYKLRILSWEKKAVRGIIWILLTK